MAHFIRAAHPATPYRAALASLIEEAVRLVGLSDTVFVGLGRVLFFGGRRWGRHYLPIPSVSLHWGVCSARAEMGGAFSAEAIVKIRVRRRMKGAWSI
jgi:hypothetical protein